MSVAAHVRVQLGSLDLDAAIDIAPGELVAVLGPNGAGKSTLLRSLAGLQPIDAGRIAIDATVVDDGDAVFVEPERRPIGVVFQQQAIDLDLTVRRNLQFHADLHGLGRATTKQRITTDCEALGLTADIDRPARELSGGTRRKVELVRALLHRPGLLLMDEATVGLDPKSRRDLLGAVRRDVRERGSCALWATHWVEEAVDADRVMLMHQGQLVTDGSPADVTHALGHATLEQGFIARTAPATASTKETARP